MAPRLSRLIRPPSASPPGTPPVGATPRTPDSHPARPSPDTSDRNTVANNVANSKLSDGILVNGNATATLLERKRTGANGHDGIEVDAAGPTVTRNTANENHEFGIDAVPGVVDGGGNRASGNGNPECLNVLC